MVSGVDSAHNVYYFEVQVVDAFAISRSSLIEHSIQ